MAKGDPMAERARAERQAILDYLNTHGAQTCHTIAAAMGVTSKQMHHKLGLMRHHDECTAEEVLVGRYRRLMFSACVRTTQPTYGVKQTTAARKTSLRRKREQRPARPVDTNTTYRGPGYYVHRCSDKNPPIANQGGQGNVGLRPMRGSVLASGGASVLGGR